jgi:hypothetical protein
LVSSCWINSNSKILPCSPRVLRNCRIISDVMENEWMRSEIDWSIIYWLINIVTWCSRIKVTNAMIKPILYSANNWRTSV